MFPLGRLLGFGFLSWLAPFAVSVCLFPIRQSNRPLFESLMAAVVALSGAALFSLYLRRIDRGFRRQGVLAGCLWCAMNIAFDLPMFSFGPMQMPVVRYLADIGVAYLALPSVCVPIGWLLESKTA